MDESESTQPDTLLRLAPGAEARASALGERGRRLPPPLPEPGEDGAPVSAEAAADPTFLRSIRRTGAAGTLSGNTNADDATTNNASGVLPVPAGEQIDRRSSSPRRARQPGAPTTTDGIRPLLHRGRGRGAPARIAARGTRPQSSGRARPIPAAPPGGAASGLAPQPSHARSDWDRDPSNDNWMLDDYEDDLDIDLTGTSATDIGTQPYPLTVATLRTAPGPFPARPAAPHGATSHAGRAPRPALCWTNSLPATCS